LNRKYHRAAGVVVCALGVLLIGIPVANADTTVGNDGDVQSFTFGFVPDFDTFSYNSTQLAIDDFLTTKAGFYLDIWYASPGDYEVLLTDSGQFQMGEGAIGGVANSIDTTNPANFIPVDIGIDHLLGITV
jgi:hypothetical protein